MLLTDISFGCCRHSVSNTFVQLTEGRSARDQPKQPPAKKEDAPYSGSKCLFQILAMDLDCFLLKMKREPELVADT